MQHRGEIQTYDSFTKEHDWIQVEASYKYLEN